MKFDSHNKVIVNTLTKEEASDFLDFLVEESYRHHACIAEAIGMKSLRPRIADVYRNAIIRHKQDTESIKKTTKMVMELKID